MGDSKDPHWNDIHGGDVTFPKFTLDQILPGCSEGGIDSGNKFIAYNAWKRQVDDYYASGAKVFMGGMADAIV